MAKDTSTVWLLLDTYSGAHRRQVMVGAYSDKATAEAYQQKLPMSLALVPVRLGARPARI